MQEDRFAGSEGRIFYRSWSPDAPENPAAKSLAPKQIVLVVHGYAEHSMRYSHLAEALVAQGAAVFAADHLGHGLSEGDRALIADFEHVVDDLEQLATIAEARYPGLPMTMIGHSMGGLLTARFIERNPDRLTGAAFLGAVLGDWKWAREVLALPELPPSDSDPSGMSRDADVCEAYALDPLVYHGKYKRPLLEAEVVCLDRFNDEIDAITIPVAFFHGTEDPFVPYADSLDAVERMPSTDTEVHLYEGARHELVNETNREEVMADISAFVSRVSG
ncbi:MAG: lysophospholipase [Actinomycetota bacterium]|jgi:alpha-beta hydrolase superfamily lysophospholipase|nr:lysophospholipase [Actinomycetota bacterium]